MDYKITIWLSKHWNLSVIRVTVINYLSVINNFRRKNYLLHVACFYSMFNTLVNRQYQLVNINIVVFF